MRITCITKRCTGSLHIEWASCVAVTQLNLYVRAQEWIDHLYLPRVLILKIASRYFHNTRNLCLSGKLRQQVQRTVDNYRNFCLRRLYAVSISFFFTCVIFHFKSKITSFQSSLGKFGFLSPEITFVPDFREGTFLVRLQFSEGHPTRI